MASRMDKYSSIDNSSRTSRNRDLYDDIYSDTNYSNSVIIDDSKEINIEKIKELINRERELDEKKVTRPSTDIYEELDTIKEKEEDKIYDINEVLKEAKSKRNILEEAHEQSKIYNDEFKYRDTIDIDEELAKTRKVYDRLVQEETELLDIMNTLTNMTVNSDKDAYKDLTTEANKYNTGNIDTKELLKEVEKEEKESPKEETEEYNSNTFIFDTRDFDIDNDEKESKKPNVLLIIFIILFVAALVLGGVFVYKEFFMK